ncbi:MAG: hypothetical protein RL757_886 [Bacteroidota bacterium]|jgi:5-methylcytosine-specific restriction enzyme subunit McrC
MDNSKIFNDFSRTIQVFEHEKLVIGEKMTAHEYATLQRFHARAKTHQQIFDLTYRGIKFRQQVGVLKVGKLTIEILPKTDKNAAQPHWQKILVEMLQQIGAFPVHAPTNAQLKLKSNTILDLYFELFLNEMEDLLRHGLIKKYNVIEKNSDALRGKLLLNQQLQKNGIIETKFYVRQNIYDTSHILHQILYKTLLLLKKISNSQATRIQKILMVFPAFSDLTVSENTFEKIRFDRKNAPYRAALQLSKLLLLNFHPDILGGKNDVLAITFDMNLLWERFVFVSLQGFLSKKYRVSSQVSVDFWKATTGLKSNMIRPDILIKNMDKNIAVLDTKWKNMGNQSPISSDLQQLFSYQHTLDSEKVALIFPAQKTHFTDGYFSKTQKTASILSIETHSEVKIWQQNIAKLVENWLDTGGGHIF